MASDAKPLDPQNRDDMIRFANSAWDSFDWEMNIAIGNQRQGKDGPMNDSQAKLDEWMAITGRDLYEEVCPPGSIILPRAEVEALRARADRLRRMVRGFSAAIEYLALGESRPPDVAAMYARACDLYVEHYSDLADDLRTLDELPPLKLADNPLDVSRAELPQNER